MTPHNEARKGDYAEAVLLPGDPERAEWIAAKFFEAPRKVNGVRGALGFTGSYRGMPISVQTTGMGRPSLSIYVHELLTVYGVKTIVRIGSCGALDESIGLRSAVIARSAAMDFEVDSIDAWRRPDDRLFELAAARAKADGHVHHISPMICSDVFYHPDPLGRFAKARARGVLACDMETSALFGLAARSGARGLSICTVVDSLVTGEEIEKSERQGVYEPMARLALDTLVDDWSARTAGKRSRA
jgi:purine-nucleoside phosphorylase